MMCYIGLFQETLKAPKLVIAGFEVPNVMSLNAPASARAEYFILVHYLSKFLDFLDTAFIVLRKKDNQFSFLHVYHHATIGPIWGLLLLIGHGTGTTIFGAMINSFTHVIMYTHYFVTSFGIKNPLKPYITLWQIFQFYCCLFHAVVVTFTDLDSIVPKSLALVQFAYHLTMVALFNRFFQRTFTPSKSAEKKSDKIDEPDTRVQEIKPIKVNGAEVRRRARATT